MITVVGEALVDLLIAPSGAVSATLGGAPFNTARGCARLGAEVEFVGALSQDRFGGMLAERLHADGVDVERAPRVGAPTTLAAAELDASGAASYNFYIDGTSAPALESVAGSGDAWFTGGLALVLEPMATAIEAAVTQGGAQFVMLDVNCRPNVIDDREAYAARIRRVARSVDVVKVSDEDLRYLLPDQNPLDAARTVLADGPSVVLLTAGADGVHVVTRSGDRFVPATRVEVVDTVGAGDTFCAGFLVAWCESGELTSFDDLDRLERAADFGARAAALAVGRQGADPPMRSEL